MPKTKFDKPKYPPVDKLKAVILERKLVMKLTYDDMANVAGVSPEYMRKMITVRHTDDWNPDARRKLCRFMGLNIRFVLDDLYNLNT